MTDTQRTKEQLREVFAETFEGYLSVAFYEAVQHDMAEKEWGRNMVEHSAKVLADDAIDILFPDDAEEERDF